MDGQRRTEATAWANKAHTYAAWLEWSITLLATLGGLIGATAVVLTRASARASGVAEGNIFFDFGLPGLIVFGAGILGYLAGLFASSRFRFMGHVVRTCASVDARLEECGD